MTEQNYKLALKPGEITEHVASLLAKWRQENTIKKIWDRDPSVWVPGAKPQDSIPELTNRLGWLDAAENTKKIIQSLKDFSELQRKSGIEDVILLGMGGSSLAPEVIMDVFGPKDGFPVLTVLDTTDPETILALMPSIDPDKTLFLVSSKSGGTIETISLFKYFYAYCQAIGIDAGKHFAAITDPGSGLEKIALDKKFIETFSSPADVGGRYSALTVFGMVPPALTGIDIEKLLERAESAAGSCGPDTVYDQNPAAVLGAFMGQAALRGRDKLTVLASPTISRIGAWIEQLVAESLGKDGKGILPVADEEIREASEYGKDRAFVFLEMAGDNNRDLLLAFDDISSKNIPSLKITINDEYDLGGLFFIWEAATAIAASVIGVNPFDQPNVESAKKKARALMAEYEKTGRIPSEKPLLVQNDIQFFSSDSIPAKTVKDGIGSFLDALTADSFIALMAYLPYEEEVNDLLEGIRARIGQKTGSAVTLGYGPRFMHSTGQLHKGGKNNGRFIQFTYGITEDIDIPGEVYSFGTLITAQAAGDYEALKDAGRRVCRLHIRGDLIENLEAVLKAL